MTIARTNPTTATMPTVARRLADDTRVACAAVALEIVVVAKGSEEEEPDGDDVEVELIADKARSEEGLLA